MAQSAYHFFAVPREDLADAHLAVPATHYEYSDVSPVANVGAAAGNMYESPVPLSVTNGMYEYAVPPVAANGPQAAAAGNMYEYADVPPISAFRSSDAHEYEYHSVNPIVRISGVSVA